MSSGNLPNSIGHRFCTNKGCVYALIIAATTMLLSVTNARADEKADTLYSNILKEKRDLQIFLPSGYKTGGKYDVLYVLDGEMLARFVAPVVYFEQENDLMPPVIIVGIKNNYWYDIGRDSRERDFLPKRVDGSPLSGGADKFLSFIGDELIPYINKTYSGSGKRILFGHSYGGLLTMYTFLTQPQMFDSYIASDPALWWNDGYVLSIATDSLARNALTNKTLFIGGRTGNIYEAFGIAPMVRMLREKAPPGLKWQNMIYANEHHGSVRIRNIYDGLKFTYFGNDASVIDFFPSDGILLKDRPVPILLYSTYLDFNPGIRYTVDGSLPTPESPRYEYGTPISAPATFTLKEFSNYGADREKTGHFVLGNLFPAVTLPSSYKAGGLQYAFYASDGTSLPSFSGVKPLQRGLMDENWNINIYVPKTPIACAIDGYFDAESDGYYTFFLEADKLANFYIDEKLLIALKVSGDSSNNRSFVVPLEKGFHQMRIEYLHQSGDRDYSLTYTHPGDPKLGRLTQLPINIPSRFQFSPPLN